jgi:hypothetical protein
MKKIITFIYFTIILLFINNIYSQETKISWIDDKGREFSVTAPSGNFSYTILAGDIITYGGRYSSAPGKEITIGNVNIEYGGTYSNTPGKIIQIGDVYIEYGGTYSNNPGKVIKVGGLEIEYGGKYSNAPGKIIQTSGKVR